MKKPINYIGIVAISALSLAAYAGEDHECEVFDPSGVSYNETKLVSHNHEGEDISMKHFEDKMYSLVVSGEDTILYIYTGIDGNFRGCTATGTNFSGISIRGANFGAANLTAASFANASGIDSAVFAGAIVYQTNFANTHIKAAQLEDTASFAIAKNMSGINLSNLYFSLLFSDASKIDFSKAKFDGTTIGQNNFDECDFREASFVGCDMNGSRTDITSFLGAKLKNADFTDASINFCQFDSAFTKEQLVSTVSMQRKSLTNISFEGNDFSGVDFSGTNLVESKFKNVNLAGAKFVNAHGLSETYSTVLEGAIITNADFSKSDIHIKTLENTQSYADKNFSGVNFSNITSNNMKLADFSEFDLSNAVFDNSNFGGGNFEYSNLSNASFVNTNLKGTAAEMTSFIGAKLDGADFTGASINFCRFDSAFTKGQLQSTAEFNSNKCFYGVSFTGNDFSGVNFKDAVFSDSAVLANVNLSHANLQNVKFYTCTVENANLTGSDLRGAYLTNSALLNSSIKKNTIMADGVIENFSMLSAADSFSIAKHNTTSTEINAKISQDNAVISNGAVLSLENGAKLDILNGKMLTVENGGKIAMETSLADPSTIYIGSNSSLEFSGDGILVVNVLDEIVGTDLFVYKIIQAADDSRIASYDVIWDKTLFVTVNGKEFDGEKILVVDGNTLTIALQIPEPSTYACILGVAALFACIINKRKRR